MSVGKRIRWLRAKNGIANQEELAYLLGIARQTVSSWERDIFLPDGANLIKLSKVLNTSIAYIMGETVTIEKDDKSAEHAAPDATKTLTTTLSLKTNVSGPMFLSIEKSYGGKTVRYDLPPAILEKMFPLIEELWKNIEQEMEGRR